MNENNMNENNMNENLSTGIGIEDIEYFITHDQTNETYAAAQIQLLIKALYTPTFKNKELYRE